MGVALAIIGVVAVLILIILAASIRILREYERGVIFRLGRLIAQKGPGLILLIPFIDQMVRIDLRTITLNVPPQEVITKDNVTVRVNAVAYFRVIDSNRAVTEVENFLLATSQIAQTTLRSVLGKAELDALLSERERRAKIIAADGEFQAAEKLTQAADIISTNPATLQLRYLQTLLEMGVNQNTTIVFPVPLDMINAFMPGKEPATTAPPTADEQR